MFGAPSLQWRVRAAHAWHQFLEDRPSVVACDTETSGVGFYDEPFCATFSWRTAGGEIRSAYVALEGDVRDYGLQIVRAMLARSRVWVFHNAKFDLQKLALVGALPSMKGHDLHDTQVIAALIDENRRKALKTLAVTVLGEQDVIEVEIKSGPNKGQTKLVPREEHELAAVRRKLKLKKEDGYHLLPRQFIVPYAMKDTEFTLRLFERMWPDLPVDVYPAYNREIEATLVLLDMESNGIGLDLPYLEQTASEYGERVMEGWMTLTDLTGDPDFNPGSVPQLTAALQARGITVDSTAEAELVKLDDDLPRAVLQYRSDKKMHTTYLTALLAEQRDGVVHPWFNVIQARTGRMSSSSASQ